MSKAAHIPVLCEEAVAALVLQPMGSYVDVTFGDGGHSRVILRRLNKGTLYAFDQDEEAQKRAKALKGLHFVAENFRHIRAALADRGVAQVTGILADLGMSTAQLYSPTRGFGNMHAASILDMRMRVRAAVPKAADLLNQATPAELRRIFTEYGELPRTKGIVHSIVEARKKTSIETVGQLKALLQRYVPLRQPARFWAQLFQALRIAVNDELEALKDLLRQAAQLLIEEGRLVVISYHSLEDRLVKRFLRYGHFERQPIQDEYGRPLPTPFMSLYKKPLRPSEAECKRNPSARSASMRVGIKNINYKAYDA